MLDKKFLYLLILILLTAAVLFSGQKGFLVQIILSALGIAWSIIILIVILLFMNQAENKKVRSFDIFIKVKGKEKLDMELLEKINGSKIYFAGGSSKSRILHFKGESATEKNVQVFLHKIGIKEFEILK